MHAPKSKTVFFVLEGLNSLTSSYFGNYVYFLLRDDFKFDTLGNLSAAALCGFAYMLASWQGGRFAQRFGYATSVISGLGGMAASLVVGAIGMGFHCLFLILPAFLGFMASMCFVWPALEALVSDGANGRDLQKNVGIYNLVWSGAMATTYFVGGTLYERLGHASIFWLPLIILGIQFLTIFSVGRAAFGASHVAPHNAVPCPADDANTVHPVRARAFLRMAWFAIPFSYVAITTVVAVIPSLAETLKLTPAQAGLLCSIWMFVRLATFITMWQWTGWHYRFRWLLGGFVGLVAGFAMLLLSHSLGFLIAAQVVFGVSIGVIYYSSLFYSMDVGDTKGEHGGLHEAMIGAGSCAGPALGALSLAFIPGSPNASVYAIATMLACGLIGLIGLRVRQTV